jgi:hypothetical protein
MRTQHPTHLVRFATIDMPLPDDEPIAPFLLRQDAFLEYPSGRVARLGPDVDCAELSRDLPPARLVIRATGGVPFAQERWVDVCGLPVEIPLVPSGGTAAVEVVAPPGPCPLTPWLTVRVGHGVSGPSVVVEAVPGALRDVNVTFPGALWDYGFLPDPTYQRVLMTFRDGCPLPDGFEAGIGLVAVYGRPIASMTDNERASFAFRSRPDPLDLETTAGRFQLAPCPTTAARLASALAAQDRDVRDRLRHGAISDDEVRVHRALMAGEGWPDDVPLPGER